MINEEIRDKEVRLIDEEGNQLGVVPVREALAMARRAQSRPGQKLRRRRNRRSVRF